MTHFIQLILASGGRFTISDDSHGPHAVGLNYQRLYGYLRDIDVKELWYLADRSTTSASIGGRRVSAARLGGEWWRDEFWVKQGVSFEE